MKNIYNGKNVLAAKNLWVKSVWVKEHVGETSVGEKHLGEKPLPVGQKTDGALSIPSRSAFLRAVRWNNRWVTSVWVKRRSDNRWVRKVCG